MTSPATAPTIAASGVDSATLARVDEALLHLSREVRLLGAVTPRDAARERARLVASFERGTATEPRWQYASQDRTMARRQAGALAALLGTLPDTALLGLYLGRARELEAEAALVDAIGTARFAAMARARFAATGPGAGDATSQASGLAREWLKLDNEPPEPTIQSDADDPRSLLCRMREEVLRLGLGFDVVVSDSLAALAAIGDTRIWVTAGRAVTRTDVERTIVHELHGHAVPRARALRLPLAIFGAGTARGGDDQEGIALVLEERAGFLRPRRQRELAGRHAVVEQMALGATFVDAVHALGREGFTVVEAVRMTERAYRGGDGRRAGLGRERVYLESFVRARAQLARAPEDLDVLSSGQVALDAAAVLRSFASPCV